MSLEWRLHGMDIAVQSCVVCPVAMLRLILLNPMDPEEGEAVMIHSSVRMVLPAARLSEVTGVLGPMVERTRAERGCLGCHLHRDALEEAVLILEDKWASEADLERHLRSHDYRQLLLVMELATVQPEVRFDRVSHSTGFETVEQARA